VYNHGTFVHIMSAGQGLVVESCEYGTELSNFLWVSSCITWLNSEETNISRTISVLVIRKLSSDDGNTDGS